MKYEKLIVKKNHKGFAVYAGKDFVKGETICVVRGRKVRPKNLYYHANNFRNSIVNPLQIGLNMYLDVAKPFIFINHSCNPNAGVRGADPFCNQENQARPGDNL